MSQQHLKKSPNHNYLIIIILIIAFTISILLRFEPLNYGFELAEFDSFFNYRSTNFLFTHGIDSYLNWHDQMSWYPDGRNISATSQIMLHMTAAITYLPFSSITNLYDFLIVFPAVVGALTTVIVFFLVRQLFGVTSGLFASLFFAILPSIIMRGTLGWFKSEPLGLFYGLLATYLFLNGISSENKKSSFLKIILASISLSFAFSSWGGTQFFIIPLALFFIVIPFTKQNSTLILWKIPLFVLILLTIVTFFERPGMSLVFGYGGIALMISAIFCTVCLIFHKVMKRKLFLYNVLIATIIIFVLIVILYVNYDTELIQTPSFRYLNVLNPFLTSTNPLVSSIAEHYAADTSMMFFFNSVLIIFSGIGIWLIFSKKLIKSNMTLFALLFAISGIYVASTFVRLELFASLSIIIFAAIGVKLLLSEIFSKKILCELKSPSKQFYKKSTNSKIYEETMINNMPHSADLPSIFNFKSYYSIPQIHIIQKNKFSSLMLFVILIVIIALLSSPMIFPIERNWSNSHFIPQSILNGGTQFDVSTNDWTESMLWLKQNTPQDSVIASWWDYGYWITTIGDRTTLTDNSTINSKSIQKISTIFLENSEQAWKNLIEWDVDYVLVFVTSQKIQLDTSTALYILGGGGDEDKIYWIANISKHNPSKFMMYDGVLNANFWNNTLLGKLFPYTPIAYIDSFGNIYNIQIPNSVPIFEKQIEYTNSENPFTLVYSSPSFEDESSDLILGVHIYQINKKYLNSD